MRKRQACYGKPPADDHGASFISPETPFATRHFTVFFDKDGTLSHTHTESIASISEESAAVYAESVLKDTARRGWFEHYRYKVFSTDQGTGVVFIDGSLHRASMIESTTIAGFVLLGCAALVWILIFLLSKRAVKPIAKKHKGNITSYAKDETHIGFRVVL